MSQILKGEKEMHWQIEHVRDLVSAAIEETDPQTKNKFLRETLGLLKNLYEIGEKKIEGLETHQITPLD